MDCVLSETSGTVGQGGAAGDADERDRAWPPKVVPRTSTGAGRGGSGKDAGLSGRTGCGRAGPAGPAGPRDLAGGEEVDHVGESEESEDEWNYFRVEPTEKESVAENSEIGDTEDMESQLNPNAAVFIPSSPTENSNHIEQPFNENLTQEQFFNKDNVMSSSYIAHDPVTGTDSPPIDVLKSKDDEVWLSSSPKKGGVPLDNVYVPPEEEFDRELSLRPGDLDAENHLNPMNGESVVIEGLQTSENILDDFCAVKSEGLEAAESFNPFVAQQSPKPPPLGDELAKPPLEDEPAKAALEDESAKPALEDESAKPALEDEPAKPALEDESAKPALEDEPAKPALEDESAKPALEDESAKPALEDESPKPALEDESPKPALEDESPKPALKDESPNPALEDESPKPALEDESPKPALEDESPKPALEGDSPKPTLEDESPKLIDGEALRSITSGQSFLHQENDINVGDDFCEASPASHCYVMPADVPEPFVEVDSDVCLKVTSASPKYGELVENVVQQDNVADFLGTMEASNGNLESFNMEKQRAHSPIVSGASDFVRDHIDANKEFQDPSSFDQGLSPINRSAEPLNEGVLYSMSGFDNMMDAPSVNLGPVSSPLDHISAQSTPFEGDAFDYEPGTTSDMLGDNPVLQHVKQDICSGVQQTEVEIHATPNQEDDLIGDSCLDIKNDMNEAFAEDSVTVFPEKANCDENQAPAIPEAKENLTELVTSNPPQFVRQDIIFEEESLVASAASVAENPSEIPKDIKLQPAMHAPETSEIESRNDDYSFVTRNNQPTVPDVCNVFNVEEEVSTLEENCTIAQLGTQGFINGSEEVVPAPDVVADVPVSEEIVNSESASDLLVAPEVTLPEIESATQNKNNEQVPVSDPLPVADPVAKKVAATAVVGLAAVAAVGGVAAAASKTDKKTANKAPVTKAKPSPAAKAPLKAATKPTQPASVSATATKKPATAPVPATRTVPRTTLASKPKPSETSSKPIVSSAPKPAAPKPRTTAPVSKSAPADKKTLTNGDTTKPVASKPLARPATRPATAPARAGTAAAVKPSTAVPSTVRAASVRKVPASSSSATGTKSKTASALTDTKPKPATLSSAAARPRPSTANTVSSTRPTLSGAKAPTASKPIDKQTKETTNKLISATRSSALRAPAASRTTVSRNTSSNNTAAAAAAAGKVNSTKPAPIRRPQTTTTTTTSTTVASKAAIGKKPSEKSKESLTNGVNGVKNGHVTPDEISEQNGISHDEPVIEKRESDYKIESLADNQLVA